MGKDGQLGQRGWIRRRGGRVIRVLHFRVVDLGVLGARVSGARWVTARASYRESMFPIATPHGVRASRRPAGAPATAAESDARANAPGLFYLWFYRRPESVSFPARRRFGSSVTIRSKRCPL